MQRCWCGCGGWECCPTRSILGIWITRSMSRGWSDRRTRSDWSTTSVHFCYSPRKQWRRDRITNFISSLRTSSGITIRSSTWITIPIRFPSHRLTRNWPWKNFRVNMHNSLSKFRNWSQKISIVRVGCRMRENLKEFSKISNQTRFNSWRHIKP